MNRLDQLFARSQREIEAHATEVAATEIGRNYIDEAAHLLAGLRLWAQCQYRSDQVIREILETADPTALQNAARKLRNMKTQESQGCAPIGRGDREVAGRADDGRRVLCPPSPVAVRRLDDGPRAGDDGRWLGQTPPAVTTGSAFGAPLAVPGIEHLDDGPLDDLDSTPLYDAVATMDTVTLIRSALRGVLAVADPPLRAQVRAALGSGDDYATLGKPQIDWDHPAAREQLIDSRARDGFAVLALIDGRELVEPVEQAAALLATVLGQDLATGEDGVFRIARRVGKDRVISTVDPDTRHGHKTAARGFDGYKGHLAVDPDSEIITATTVTPGNTGDAAVAADLIADLGRTDAAGNDAARNHAARNHAARDRSDHTGRGGAQPPTVYGDKAGAVAPGRRPTPSRRSSSCSRTRGWPGGDDRLPGAARLEPARSADRRPQQGVRPRRRRRLGGRVRPRRLADAPPRVHRQPVAVDVEVRFAIHPSPW